MTALVCKECGEEYQVKPSRVGKSRFCSRKCFGAWRSKHMSGRNSPRWSQLPVICKQCSKEFYASRYAVEGGRKKFCSKACLGKWISGNMCGESSPNYKSEKVTCPICGVEFDRAPWEAKDGRKNYCSRKCFNQWQSENMGGENHQNWNGDDEERECIICGERFTVRPHSEQKTCGSRECRSISHSQSIHSESHYNWQGGPETRICEWCGEEYEIYQRSPQRFCGQKCMGKYFSRHRSGENHPSFNPDKKDRVYPPEFGKPLKRKIRKRDNHSCAICHLYGHEVHHINYKKEDCNPLNLITLCHSCHGTTNFNRPYWQSALTSLVRVRHQPFYLM